MSDINKDLQDTTKLQEKVITTLQGKLDECTKHYLTLKDKYDKLLIQYEQTTNKSAELLTANQELSTDYSKIILSNRQLIEQLVEALKPFVSHLEIA